MVDLQDFGASLDTGSRVPAASVLFLCTGNAARSVMGGVALRACRADMLIDTAGTLAVDGLPMSWRTRAAIGSVGLALPTHRSKQAYRVHLDAADLVIAMAPEHVDWVRRNHPHASHHTATLKYLAGALTLDDRPLRARVASLGLAQHAVRADEEIIDPGGGEVDVFIACAHEVFELINRLAPTL
jgi:protein-tyrosine phosphatase